MMQIIYTCPECGCDLRPYEICTNPPIPGKYCPNCGKRRVMKFWDHACWYSARSVCCPMCDKDNCTPHANDCEAEKWYKKHIEDYRENE